ncbi:hypothetical protein DFH06DRAFT_1123777 [Mycena polygramma]|nr:hypothetical protein DFH06DRAFT_1123777 [Mycena polygramma]
MPLHSPPPVTRKSAAIIGQVKSTTENASLFSTIIGQVKSTTENASLFSSECGRGRILGFNPPVTRNSAAIIGQVDHRKCLFILHRWACRFEHCHPPSGHRTEIRIFLHNPPPARVCSPPPVTRKSAAIIGQVKSTTENASLFSTLPPTVGPQNRNPNFPSKSTSSQGLLSTSCDTKIRSHHWSSRPQKMPLHSPSMGMPLSALPPTVGPQNRNPNFPSKSTSSQGLLSTSCDTKIRSHHWSSRPQKMPLHSPHCHPPSGHRTEIRIFLHNPPPARVCSPPPVIRKSAAIIGQVDPRKCLFILHRLQCGVEQCHPPWGRRAEIRIFLQNPPLYSPVRAVVNGFWVSIEGSREWILGFNPPVNRKSAAIIGQVDPRKCLFILHHHWSSRPQKMPLYSPPPVTRKSAAIIGQVKSTTENASLFSTIIGQVDHRKCLFILHRWACRFEHCHPPSGHRTEIRIFLHNPPPARVCSPPPVTRKSAAIIGQVKSTTENASLFSTIIGQVKSTTENASLFSSECGRGRILGFNPPVTRNSAAIIGQVDHRKCLFILHRWACRFEHCHPPSGHRTEIRIFLHNPPPARVCSPPPVIRKSAAIIGQVDHRKCLFILHRWACRFQHCHPPSGHRTEIRIFLQNPPPARVCSPPPVIRKSAAIIGQVDHRKCLFILHFISIPTVDGHAAFSTATHRRATEPKSEFSFTIHLQPGFALQ